MRKQLDLIFTALLPVMVLVVGFFAVSSKAGLRTVVIPEGATPHYEEKDNGFGPEINSNHLCPPADPDEGFDIYYTSETASVSVPNYPGKPLIRWYRFQRWDFTSDNTPWGTNYAEATTSGLINIHAKEDGSYVVPRGSSGTGFPWSGYEIHSRFPQYQYILVMADVTGWRYYKHHANKKEYICPNYYKTSTNYRYFCRGGFDPGIGYKAVYNSKQEGKPYYFSKPMFRDEEQHILSREELRKVGKKVEHTGNWHNCIEVN